MCEYCLDMCEYCLDMCEYCLDMCEYCLDMCERVNVCIIIYICQCKCFVCFIRVCILQNDLKVCPDK